MPFGRPVVPEEYIIADPKRSGEMGCADELLRAFWYPMNGEGGSSTSITYQCSTFGQMGTTSAMTSSSALLVSTTRAALSAMT